MCQFMKKYSSEVFQVLQYGLHLSFLFGRSDKTAAWLLERTDRAHTPKTFVSCLPFCWCLCIGWRNKKCPASLSVCLNICVFFIENRAPHRLGSRDPGSLWCYCWITEGIGQQISRGLSAGVEIGVAVRCRTARTHGGSAARAFVCKSAKKKKKNGAVPLHVVWCKIT